jgi:hypothetical protein
VSKSGSIATTCTMFSSIFVPVLKGIVVVIHIISVVEQYSFVTILFGKSAGQDYLA